MLKPITMSLFGMLNWNYLWFRWNGRLSRRDYAKLAVTVLIEGAQALAGFENRRSQGNGFSVRLLLLISLESPPQEVAQLLARE